MSEQYGTCTNCGDRVLFTEWPEHREQHGADTRRHQLRYPPSPSRAGCTCGWEDEVPLGHSKADAFLDHRLLASRAQ